MMKQDLFEIGKGLMMDNYCQWKDRLDNTL